MNARTLKALQGSIEHWEENVAAEDIHDTSIGSRRCKLCHTFPSDDCEGCPVAEKVGQPLCIGTPYEVARVRWNVWLRATLNNGLREEELKTEWRKAAQAELDFLRSLLP